MVDVNAKNSEGETALDILHLDLRSGYSMYISMRLLAFAFPSFVKGTPSEYLRSKTSMYDLSLQFGAYLQFGLPGEIRSAFLVIIALVATATYHAALAPPSAFSNGQNTFVNAIFPNTTSDNATTYILPNSTNIDNETQITNFTIVNTICFGMAMGTSFILTFHPLLYAFLYGPLILFLVAYAFLTHGMLNTGSIISAMLVACWVPISSVIPWWIIIIRKHILSKRSDDYSLSEAIYLIFSSKYTSRRSQEEGSVSIISLIFRN
ncbi:uncharacterized protein Fot_13461 [Forsythia ovata]|uniref:PGG domain-containing protein n=1 Tax=Forsythia ovata TaxID=205694 RepID=A0ABD1W5J8_9LAMI